MGELTADAFKSACGSAGVERCTRLSLARRGLTDVGAVLAAVNLADLDLSRNRLGERPWRIVGLRKLRTLHLGWCAIRELGDSLHDLASLEHLLMQGNLVEDAGALARSLARLPSLRSLYLRENDGGHANPCCSAPGYREDILRALPNLRNLDGERLRDAEVADGHHRERTWRSVASEPTSDDDDDDGDEAVASPLKGVEALRAKLAECERLDAEAAAVVAAASPASSRDARIAS